MPVVYVLGVWCWTINLGSTSTMITMATITHSSSFVWFLWKNGFDEGLYNAFQISNKA